MTNGKRYDIYDQHGFCLMENIPEDSAATIVKMVAADLRYNVERDGHAVGTALVAKRTKHEGVLR